MLYFLLILKIQSRFAIIDEEQRFGVSHKEKLKIKSGVHLLTLTATPIPEHYICL